MTPPLTPLGVEEFDFTVLRQTRACTMNDFSKSADDFHKTGILQTPGDVEHICLSYSLHTLLSCPI